MREIKFRAWDKRKKEWFSHGEPFWIIGETTIFDLLKQVSIDHLNEIEIMQYTGLKDKNGKEIYEGDIIQPYDSGTGKPPYGRKLEIGKVEYGSFQSSHEAGCSRGHYHIGFYLANKNGEQIWDMVSEDIFWEEVEVIGNIYENPELLNVGSGEQNGELKSQISK